MEVSFGKLTQDQRCQLIQHWKAMGAPGVISAVTDVKLAIKDCDSGQPASCLDAWTRQGN